MQCREVPTRLTTALVTLAWIKHLYLQGTMILFLNNQAPCSGQWFVLPSIAACSMQQAQNSMTRVEIMAFPKPMWLHTHTLVMSYFS